MTTNGKMLQNLINRTEKALNELKETQESSSEVVDLSDAKLLSSLYVVHGLYNSEEYNVPYRYLHSKGY